MEVASVRLQSGEVEATPTAPGEFRCGECGYGIFVARLPDACPMCRSAQWELASWRPFTRRGRPR